MNPITDRSAAREIEASAARWVARRDAGLSPAEERDFQQWLDADPRHRHALGYYNSAWSALAKPSRSGAGLELEYHLASLARKRRRRRAAFGSVGTCIVLFGIGLVAWNPPRVADQLSPPTAVVVKPARQSLPDGSVVELKGDARIAVQYTVNARRVVLQMGEAHFDVQKDSERPFVVSAGGVDVRAVGTAFSVALGSTAVEVLVTNGRVAVDKSAAPAAADLPSRQPPLATLEAGKRAVVGIEPSATPTVSDILPAELDQRLAWRSPRLEFTRTPLAEAVALLNQHAGPSAARLEIVDHAVAKMRVSGVFRADNTDAFILLMEGAFGIKSERAGNTIALRKAP
jgi:transmembrane sensor